MADNSTYKDVYNYASANEVELVAVSKTRSNEEILAIYQQGQRTFGENRVQEMVAKHTELPKDINWHLIGSLQKNKVKYIAEFVDVIHACDSLSLLEVINKQAAKHNRTIKVLLQIKISAEQTKQGFELEDCTNMLESNTWNAFTNVQIIGLMGMASFTDYEVQLRNEFQSLSQLFEKYKRIYFQSNENFKELSMGMSGDYKIAINEGSTMIRVGSLIFGPRQY